MLGVNISETANEFKSMNDERSMAVRERFHFLSGYVGFELSIVGCEGDSICQKQEVCSGTTCASGLN